MYYILRNIKHSDYNHLHTAKETGCRTLKAAEAFVAKEIKENLDPRFTYIITEAVVQFAPDVAIKKTPIKRDTTPYDSPAKPRKARKTT